MRTNITNNIHFETIDHIKIVEIFNIPIICLRNGGNFKIEVETEEENQLNVSVKRNENKIRIDFLNDGYSEHFIIYITIPNNSLHMLLKNVISLYTDEATQFFIDDFHLDAESVTNIRMEYVSHIKFICNMACVTDVGINGSANECVFNFQNVTNVKMKKFEIHNLDLKLNNCVDVDFCVIKTIKTNINNIVSINIEGNPESI